MRACDVCGATYSPRARTQRACSPDCGAVLRRAAQRRWKASGGAGSTRRARVCIEVDETSPLTLTDGRRRCSAGPCLRYAPLGETICGECLPRFDSPLKAPARATYDELAHATYGGISIAAQAAERLTDEQRLRMRRRAQRLATKGRTG